MAKIYILAASAPKMGAGHVMRVRARLRGALDSGHQAILASRIEVPWVRERLERDNIPVEYLPLPIPSEENPIELLSQIEAYAPDWVVLDGYHFGTDSQSAVREAGFRLLFIDDYAHLQSYDVDFLLNQNPGSENLRYRGRIDYKLFGPSYALLRAEFLAARQKVKDIRHLRTPNRLLLTLGGGDASSHLANLAPVLCRAELQSKQLAILGGRMPIETILSALSGYPSEISILSAVEDMPAILLNTDLAITAGGSTCWELCCLGVPFLTVEVAENQRMVVESLAQLGIAPRLSIENLDAYLAEASNIKDVRLLEMMLVDGLGVKRILSNMLGCEF